MDFVLIAQMESRWMRDDDSHILPFITRFIASVQDLWLITITRLFLALNTYIGRERISENPPQYLTLV